MLSDKIFSVFATGILATLVISSSIFTPAYAQHKKGTVIRTAIGIALAIPVPSGYNLEQDIISHITPPTPPIPHITPSDGIIGHK